MFATGVLAWTYADENIGILGLVVRFLHSLRNAQASLIVVIIELYASPSLGSTVKMAYLIP